MKKYNLSDIILCLKKRDIDMIINRMVLVCLLYTSQSPRDRQRSRMPSSA